MGMGQGIGSLGTRMEQGHRNMGDAQGDGGGGATGGACRTRTRGRVLGDSPGVQGQDKVTPVELGHGAGPAGPPRAGLLLMPTMQGHGAGLGAPWWGCAPHTHPLSPPPPQDDLFADLANLSHLFLHGNRVRALSEGVFRGLPSLDRLLLHANRLAAIHRRAFQGLARLTILYLFNNSLVALPGDPLAALPALQFLRLNANPWACDCRARPLWAWFRRTRVSSSPVTCASPPHRRGTDLRHLRPRDFDACPDEEEEEEEDGGGGGGGGVAVMGTPGRALGRPGTLPAAPPSAFYRDGLPPHDLRGPQPRPPPPSRDSHSPPGDTRCPRAPCTPTAAATPCKPHILLPLLGLLLPWL